MVKKFFGGTKEADHESAFVTIAFTPEELSAIKQNRLGDRLVYEHPQDLSDYEEGQELAVTHPNSYAGQHPSPRYKRSRMVHHFVETPAQEVYAYLDTPIRFAEIQKSVGDNLREIKQLLEGIQSFPTDKTEFEI